VRAFPPASVGGDAGYTEELMRRIRHRPSAPLLALARYRLSRFDRSRLRARAATGEAVVRGLPPSFDHPGRNAPLRTHWVVPVVAPEPEVVVRRLRDAGFDAARATSSIAALAAPDDRPDLVPHAANALMAGIVFVPAPPELGARRLRRLVAALAAAGRAEEQRHRERLEVHA
jgi:dTDP-4-amino-4,6-dideoxygalactose transaminase